MGVWVSSVDPLRKVAASGPWGDMVEWREAPPVCMYVCVCVYVYEEEMRRWRKSVCVMGEE